MPELTGVHLLLTYRCTHECDHCFVWGSPRQTGTMTVGTVSEILRQAAALGTVRWIWFEGGEPFLFYPTLLEGARRAHEAGFRVGIVTNAYQATSELDAALALRPFARFVDRLSISSDRYHSEDATSPEVARLASAAASVGIVADTIEIARPGETAAEGSSGEIPAGTWEVMYRGRAAVELAPHVDGLPWSGFDRCPHEDLRDPGRVHIDPPGYVQICQGLALGNVHREPLRAIWERYDPDRHPVIGPLLRGGPAALVREYDLPPRERYADACHVCDAARRALRSRFPEILAPDQVYGPPASAS